jgi:hypothetical protein
MTATREVTTVDVTTFTAGNATASRCGHRISRKLRGAVIDQRSLDDHRARPALRRLGRGGI